MEHEHKDCAHVKNGKFVENSEENDTCRNAESCCHEEHDQCRDHGEEAEGVVCCCGKEHGKSDKKARVGEVVSLAASLVFLILGYFDWAEIGFLPFYYVNPSWVSVALCGAPIFAAAAKSIAKIKITTPILIAMAMTAAIVLEIVGFFYNVENDGHGHSYVFAAGEIAFLMALGGFIEDAVFRMTEKRIEKIEENSGHSVAIDTDNRANRAHISETADKLATFIVPFVLITAVAVGLVSGFAFRLSAVDAVIRAVTVLVAFCPCSLALAAPIAVAAGTGRLAMDGIFVKSGGTLEILGKVTAVCCDENCGKKVCAEGFSASGKVTAVANCHSSCAAQTVGELKQSGKTVLYVGNNVEAAEKADCSASVGCAAEVSDVTVLSDDAGAVKTALGISKRTILTVKCNIIFALTVNFASVLLSFFGLLSPAAGALVHNCTSVFVVLASVSLLYEHKIKRKTSR